LETNQNMSRFTEQFRQKQTEAHRVNVANGWWAERYAIEQILSEHNIDNSPHEVIELLGLAATEIAEAIEAARKHPKSQWGDANTKDTLVRECAGTVVRLMDLCEAYGLPLGEAIDAEIEANAARGYKHGGKAA